MYCKLPRVGCGGRLGAELWIGSTIQKGCCIPFLACPPLLISQAGFPCYQSNPSKFLALRQEVLKKLDKRALEVAKDRFLNFYYRLLLVEKASRGWRPVIDLSPMNEFVLQTPFRMETAVSVLKSVREGIFMGSIDFKDAYFQVPVYWAFLEFLCLVCQGTTSQFKLLGFALLMTPQVFASVFM